MAPPKPKNRTVDLAAYAQPDIADLNVEHPRDRGMRSRGGYGDERGPRSGGPREDDFGDDWRVGRPAASQTYGLEPSFSSRGGAAEGGRRGGEERGYRPRDNGGYGLERGGPSYDRPFERGPPRERSRERRPPADEDEPERDWRSGRPSASLVPAATVSGPVAGGSPQAIPVSNSAGGPAAAGGIPKRKLVLGAVSSILSKRGDEEMPAEKKEGEELQQRVSTTKETVSVEAEAVPVASLREVEGAEEKPTVEEQEPEAAAAAEPVYVTPSSLQTAESALEATRKEEPVPPPAAAVETGLKKKRMQVSLDALHSGKGLTLTRTKAVDAAAHPPAPREIAPGASPVSVSPAPAPVPMRDTASMGRTIMGEDELEAERGGYSAAGISGRAYGGFGSTERSRDRDRDRERRGGAPRYDRYEREDRYEPTPSGGAAGVVLKPERLGGAGRPPMSFDALADHKPAARPVAVAVTRPAVVVPVASVEEEVEQQKKKKVNEKKAAMRAKREELEKSKKQKAEAKTHNTKFVREDLFNTSVNDFNAIVAKIEPCFDQAEPVNEPEAFKLVKAIGDISKKVWRSTVVLLALHLVVIKKIQEAATTGMQTEPKQEVTSADAEGAVNANIEYAEMLMDKYLAPAAEKAVRHALPLLEAVHQKQESLFEEDFCYINLQCMMRTFGTSGMARLAPSVSLADLVLLSWLKLNTPFVSKALILEFYDDKEDETEGRSKALTQMIQLVNWLKEAEQKAETEGDEDEAEDEEDEEVDEE